MGFSVLWFGLFFGLVFGFWAKKVRFLGFDAQSSLRILLVFAFGSGFHENSAAVFGFSFLTPSKVKM